MLRWIVVFLLVISILFGGYYIFNNVVNSKSTPQTNDKKIRTQVKNTNGNLEQREKELEIPEGQTSFFGKVIIIQGSMLAIQPTRTSKTLTVKLDSKTTYLAGKQSDIIKGIGIAGIGKTNSDGSITALKLEIKTPLPTKQ